MKYWDNLDSDLKKLLHDGYCYLSPIQDIFPLGDLYQSCAFEIGDKTYAENLSAHKRFIEEIGVSSVLLPALYALARTSMGYTGEGDDEYHISRLVRPGDLSEGYRGHFDSHLFTLVIPVQIPTNNEDNGPGSLIFYPNARVEPKNEFHNFLGKLYFKRYASETGFASLANKSYQGISDFRDSRPLLFLGRQTFHGNLPVATTISQNRLTLLSHFFDPGPSWGVGQILRKIRGR